jgi:hypothetical protein
MVAFSENKKKQSSCCAKKNRILIIEINEVAQTEVASAVEYVRTCANLTNKKNNNKFPHGCLVSVL